MKKPDEVTAQIVTYELVNPDGSVDREVMQLDHFWKLFTTPALLIDIASGGVESVVITHATGTFTYNFYQGDEADRIVDEENARRTAQRKERRENFESMVLTLEAIDELEA